MVIMALRVILKLIISFENKPRIAEYTPHGSYLRRVKTDKKLRQWKSFRHKNKALESVALHPKYGVLTAAEKPLKANSIEQQTLYSSNGKKMAFQSKQGQKWLDYSH